MHYYLVSFTFLYMAVSMFAYYPFAGISRAPSFVVDAQTPSTFEGHLYTAFDVDGSWYKVCWVYKRFLV